jgi:uncharacterized repeat protein (TIGR04138 family)
MPDPVLQDILRHDPRYPIEAYEFVLQAAEHSRRIFERRSSRNMLLSPIDFALLCCDLARTEFGMMARAVFRAWGLLRTADLGEVVINLVEANKIPSVGLSRRDFETNIDLERKLSEGLAIPPR